jgi:hypothetical protein
MQKEKGKKAKTTPDFLFAFFLLPFAFCSIANLLLAAVSWGYGEKEDPRRTAEEPHQAAS